MSLKQLIYITILLLSFGSVQAQGHVFPGDANADGRVDQYDLLPMAYAFGASGPIRHNGTGQEPEEILALWPDAFPDGTNYIHADANGNGFVDILDFITLFQNQGIVHDEEDQAPPQALLSENDYSLVLNDGNPVDPNTISGTLQIPVYVSAMNPDGDINGVAFEVSWDTEYVLGATFEYDPSWIGFDDQAMAYTFQEDNRLNIAISRMGPNPAIGGGILGTLNVIIIEDLVDIRPADPDLDLAVVELSGITSVDGDFLPHEISGQSLFFTPISSVSSTSTNRQTLEATIFPNPSFADVNITSEQGFEKIDLVDISGRQTTLYEGPRRQSWIIDASTLPAGPYFLRLQGQNGQGIYRFIRSAE
ncbi:MAG: T9SS type A sorting domain-containing protein [Bacteroidota bacterium]